MDACRCFDRFPGRGAAACRARRAAHAGRYRLLELARIDAVDGLLGQARRPHSARYGGNKVRKLEFLLGDALAQGARRCSPSARTVATTRSPQRYMRARSGSSRTSCSRRRSRARSPARTLLAHAGLGHTSTSSTAGTADAPRSTRSRALAERDGVEPYDHPDGRHQRAGRARLRERGARTRRQGTEPGSRRPAATLPTSSTSRRARSAPRSGSRSASPPWRAHDASSAVRVTPDRGCDRADRREARRRDRRAAALARPDASPR